MVDRHALQAELASMLRGDADLPAVRLWIRTAIIGNEVHLASNDSEFLLYALCRLDAAADDEPRFTRLAHDVEALLRAPISDTNQATLFELAAERRRFADVAAKYRAGVLSRTEYLSYLTDQRWPTEIGRAIAALSAPEAARLTEALSRGDYGVVDALLLR